MDPKTTQSKSSKSKASARQLCIFSHQKPMEDDTLMLHPRKKPKMSLVKVKTITKNPMSICGEMNVKSKEMTIQCVGKPPTQGLIKLMPKFLMKQKMSFKIHILDEEGNKVHSEGAEGEDELAEDNLLHSFSHEDDEITDTDDDSVTEDEEVHLSPEDLEGSEDDDEDTSAQHAIDAAAEDAAQQEAMRAKLNAILIAISKKVQPAFGQSDQQDKALKQHLGEIKAAVEAADDKATQAGVKVILDILAQPTANGKNVNQKDVVTAIKELQIQRTNVEANLGSLLFSLKSHQEPRMQLIAAKEPSEVLMGNASVLKGHLDVVMVDIKILATASPSTKRDAVAKKLSGSITTLNAHKNSDNLISSLEKNPLGVTVSIKHPITAALKELKQNDFRLTLLPRISQLEYGADHVHSIEREEHS